MTPAVIAPGANDSEKQSEMTLSPTPVSFVL